MKRGTTPVLRSREQVILRYELASANVCVVDPTKESILTELRCVRKEVICLRAIECSGAESGW